MAGAAAAAALLLVLGVLLGTHWGSSRDVPAAGSVDAGFALDMQAHHRQAVEMSTLVLDRTDDEAVRTLARDIQLTQQQQTGQMYAWLEQWGLGQGRTEPVMAWMADAGEHAGHEMGMDMADVPEGRLGSVADMPGMATVEQMDALRGADGELAERVFLQLMATHHVAGVEMAEVAAERAEDPDVRHLAQAMAQGQEAEIAVLEDLLAERGGPVAEL
ncbi:DUF305 domain-containing protein [Pseudokineococcus sp. 1T1Z-3]|uniref:DUF305 domain-containing protein n=1 Tax=Pseudokineococcus sp. 1T1Z-3 TaxID=3132745 RepID=UPI0030A466FF